MTVPSIDAPLVLGAQLDARAAHPEVADRIAVRHGDRVWSYRQFRDESVRTAAADTTTYDSTTYTSSEYTSTSPAVVYDYGTETTVYPLETTQYETVTEYESE